jgi:hypothetical protein
LFALLCTVAPAKAESILLVSTTSVDNSGLLARILPLFTAKTGIEVRVLAQGTGQALATAARGDADLVLEHDPEAEAKFIAAGHGILRREIRLERLHFLSVPKPILRISAAPTMRLPHCAALPRRRRPSSLAAIPVEPTRWRSGYGKWPASIPPGSTGTGTSAVAWARC